MSPLIIVITVGLLAMTLFWLKTLTPRQRRRTSFQLILVTLAIALLFLAITGRMHWLGAVIGALLPFVRKVLPWILRVAPFIQKYRNRARPTVKTSELTKGEAFEVLGLKNGASRDEIIAAHKRLIQKAHPDRGGSDWLAARINAAKETLLKD